MDNTINGSSQFGPDGFDEIIREVSLELPDDGGITETLAICNGPLLNGVIGHHCALTSAGISEPTATFMVANLHGALLHYLFSL